jgi:hypothetical protein
VYNSEMYLMEKQANRRTKPLSRAEMRQIYGRGQSHKPTWLQRSGDWLIAAGQKLQAQGQSPAATPALGAKS